MKYSFAHNPLRFLVFIVILGLLTIGLFLVLIKTNDTLRQELLQHPFVQNFKHTYNSFRKIPDLLFIPYLFADSQLPVYHVDISRSNISRMNSALSENPLFGKLLEENKVFVGATFTDQEGYADRVDIKFRGLNANHWNALKKSYRVRFPEDHLWEGQYLVNFVTPYDRAYYAEPLNMYRAEKFGLIYTPMHFARLNINDTDTGVYLVFEHWTPELLEKQDLPHGKLFGLRDGDIERAESLDDYVNIFDKDGDTEKVELKRFLALLYEADDITFKALIPEMFDLEKLYRWNILNILAGSNHQDEAGNTIIYFNDVTGKLELVPWDTSVDHPEVYDDRGSLLIRRVLSISEFRVRRDELLREYIEDESSLSDDLEFYDNLYGQTKADFLKDTHKFHTNFRYLETVKNHREWVIDNFDNARVLLSPEHDYSL